MVTAQQLATIRSRRWCLTAALVGLTTGVTSQAATVTYSISYDDPAGLGASLYQAIDSHFGAALQDWANHLQGAAEFEVIVRITDAIPRATGRSLTSGFVRYNGSHNIFEQGMAYELRTGIDPNGPFADVEIQFNPDYLLNELWFDPDPYSRVAPVAPNRTDAMSVMLHEIGHALAFNGWGHPFTGEWPASYASTWDELVRLDGGYLYFFGASAASVYGSAVPVTMGNNGHVGNSSGPGTDLIPDLMNGVVYYRETRYTVSELNLAMLRDMGLDVVLAPIPELPSSTLLAAGLTLLLGARRRFAVQRCQLGRR